MICIYDVLSQLTGYMQVMDGVRYIVIDMPAELPSLTKGFLSYILAIAHCAQARKKVSNGKLYSGLSI